ASLLRTDDLAAHAGAGNAGRTALARAIHPGRASVPPGVAALPPVAAAPTLRRERCLRYNCRMPGLLLALAAVMGVLLLAAGDVRAVSEKEAQREIESIERALGFDRERERRLQAERRAIEKELADLDRQMVEAARRVQAQEAAVTGSEEKLRELVRQAEEVQADLGHRREQMIGTLSALQRL